jgi:hypothetical protein
MIHSSTEGVDPVVLADVEVPFCALYSSWNAVRGFACAMLAR